MQCDQNRKAQQELTVRGEYDENTPGRVPR